MTDLHSHILPHFDDGAKSNEEALALIRMELLDNVTTVAFTPHFHLERRTLTEFLAQREKVAEAFLKYLPDDGSKLRFLKGAEVRLTPELLQCEDKQNLCYTGTRYMLVELPMMYSEWIPDVLYKLRLSRIIPVIAHVERYQYMQKNAEILYDLVSEGAITQVNAASIVKRGVERRLIFKYMKYGLVHLVASDTHSVAHRPPMVKKAMDVVSGKFGEDYARYLADNGDQIAEDQDLELMEAVRPVRKWSFNNIR